ncbi:uncharacterized protein F5Z01DRAFT_670967 [Emericellopsis atlantica]|uniref:Uncharacterized protein n=1 Tax=Emericellopsis atlantica TaxID=2614577 RepID=A0A9P7ZS80_9HYPO|nr:uncharacterized protein F5Z01DRAFT_670967 [Emericellopsis atlantica]KAG9257359.1 hypothetical protein F5Z01DRAFT_670967 [Emericellopsis atlantica]
MAAESSQSLRPTRRPSISFGPPRFGSSTETLELPSPTSVEEGTPVSRSFSRVSNRLRRSLSSRLPSLRERSHETDRENCSSPVESINPITPEYLAYLAHCSKSDPVDTVEECPLEVQRRCGRQLRYQENGNLTMDMVTPSGSSAHSYLERQDASTQEACTVDQAHGPVEGDNASFTSSVYDQDDSSQEGIDAPVTPPIGTVFESEDLSKYSRGNDNLDNLMSDYASRNESVDEVVHPAAADAELADQGWHSFVVPMTAMPTTPNKVPTPSPESIEVWKRSVRQGS